MLEDDPTPEQGVREESASRILSEQEMEEADANTVDPEVISYMEAPAHEFKKVSTWAGIAVATPWTPYSEIS